MINIGHTHSRSYTFHVLQLRERDREIESSERHQGRESRMTVRDGGHWNMPNNSSHFSSSDQMSIVTNASSSSNKMRSEESISGTDSNMEWWLEDVTFTKIAATHSSLLAIDDRGLLHQWEWSSMTPVMAAELGGHAHLRALELGLSGEKIVTMDASYLRASVLTESKKVSSLSKASPGHMTALFT